MYDSHEVRCGAGKPAPQQDAGARRCGFARRLAYAVVLCGWGATTGCYAYVPVERPSPGMVASFSLTDAGRVSLGPQIGQGVQKFEGTVQAATDTGYVLQMRSVTYINGQTNRWMGERVAVAPQSVMELRQRRFSKRRTAIVTAAAIGGVVAFIATRSILGSGSERGDPPPIPPSEQ